MFYVGHFWWVGETSEIKTIATPTGWFTLIAEADSVEAAGEKFRELVEDLGSWYSGFDAVREVFVNGVVEVRRLPERGVLAHFETNDAYGSLEAPALPGVSGEFCVPYAPAEEEGEPQGAFVSFVQ